MTQIDSNTPAAGTASKAPIKRAAKTKTSAAKPAPKPAAPADEIQKQELTSSQAELQEMQRDDALLVIVKNAGFQTVFEPLSKTSVGPGETAEIRCSTGQFKRDVLNNLKQFIGLGKKLEICNA